jgi:hypothetical protein
MFANDEHSVDGIVGREFGTIHGVPQATRGRGYQQEARATHIRVVVSLLFRGYGKRTILPEDKGDQILESNRRKTGIVSATVTSIATLVTTRRVATSTALLSTASATTYAIEIPALIATKWQPDTATAKCRKATMMIIMMMISGNV